MGFFDIPLRTPIYIRWAGAQQEDTTPIEIYEIVRTPGMGRICDLVGGDDTHYDIGKILSWRVKKEKSND